MLELNGVRLDVDAVRKEIPADEACHRVWWNGFGGTASAFLRFEPTNEIKFNEDTGRTERMFRMTEWSCSHPRGKVWPLIRDTTVEDLVSLFTEISE